MMPSMRWSGLGAKATTTYRAIAIVAFASQFVPASLLRAQQLYVEALNTEYQQNPIGIDVRAPRLSWRIQSERRGTMHSAYHIRVATDSTSLARAPLWDPGNVPSESSIFRPYGGPGPHSATRYYWH